MHPKIFAAFMWIKVISLVVVLWGVTLTLVFSTGWRNPFMQVSWYGVQAPGWLFDLAYARANDLPSGAHIISWLSCGLFGLLICYKTMPWHKLRERTMHFYELLADPFQGIAGLIFIGGVHESLWVTFYYATYWRYLDWSLSPEVLRDVSFSVMMVLFIAAFWKYPNRIVPLSIFKWPVLVYLAYLIGWCFIPVLFGYPLLPITTLNNPKFGTGLYEETPWFGLWWVNLIEVGSWVLLVGYSAIQVLRYRKR